MLLTGEMVTIENVGYFRSPVCNDFVFFLPKVLLEKVDGISGDRVFVVKNDPLLSKGFSPEELIDPDVRLPDGRELGEMHKSFLYEFAVWIYRAIAQYKTLHPDTKAIWQHRTEYSGSFRRKYVTNTLLDVILALRRFHNENRDYFTFKVKEAHSGFHKINWTRTIAKSQAVLRAGQPIYLNPKNKKRTINFDEELLVIFYSILNYVRSTFGFSVDIHMGYELITGEKFVNYLKGYGVKRLRQIKYKYFSDRDLTLWQLCYAFFEKAHRATTMAGGEEYLLAKNFEIIFESIIDDLVGDSKLNDLRELSDGKEIDHLYIDESLTRRSTGGHKTFYIADSKYYKRGNALSAQSVAKQFTYARNLLQLDLDIFLNEPDDLPGKYRQHQHRLKEVGKLRDDVTEGYDVIPNFFISATVSEDFDYGNDRLALHEEGKTFHNIHFENRLFDRDTLILSHYDVNFLYVIKLYARNDSLQKATWRSKVRTEFKRHIRAFLEERFTFYAMMPYDNLSDEHTRLFLSENFHEVLGKVYAPYSKVNGKSVYSLALEKPEAGLLVSELTEEARVKYLQKIEIENQQVLNLLKRVFYVVPCKLGDDPSQHLQETARMTPIPGAPADNLTDHVLIIKKYPLNFLHAVREQKWLPWLQRECVNPHVVQMLILPYSRGAAAFHVKFDEGIRIFSSVSELKKEFSEFSAVELPEDAYYAWAVEEIKSEAPDTDSASPSDN